MAGVTRRFNDTVAVDALDMAIPKGSVVGVIGPSGSGKTTTIRMITGSLGPTEGKVEVLGENPSTFRRSTRERIGYMPQKFSLYPDLTVGENVDFAAAIYGLLFWRRWRRRRAVLELVELWDVRRRRAGQLSGGMQRRLELAASLVHEPDLLILDEPTAGVDIEVRRSMWEFLRRINSQGTTIILTTHYLEEAESLCRHIAIIDEGRIIENDRMSTVLRKLHTETFVLNLREPLQQLPALPGYRVARIDETTLEIEVTKEQNLNAIFGALSAAGIEVLSMRNKANRLEELFLRLVEGRDVGSGQARTSAGPAG
jgi:ABC-2 type transport system ATP-binding protein